MKTITKKAISIFIIAIGVVAALLFAAHNPPFWFLFGLSPVSLIFGLYVLRTTVKSELQISTEKNSDKITIENTLGEATKKIQTLITSIETGATKNFLEQLNTINLNYYRPFTDNSMFWIEKYGMKKYADLMIPFALSERLLNRSISAAIDNYFDESFQALKDCYGHLKDVIEIEDIKTERTG